MTDIETTRVKSMRPHTADILHAWVLPGGQKVLTVDAQGLAIITNLLSSTPQAKKFERNEVENMTLSRDGMMLVAAGGTVAPRIYDLYLDVPSKRPNGTLTLTEEQVRSVMEGELTDGSAISSTRATAVAANNGMVFVAYQCGSVGVWDARAAGRSPKLVAWLTDADGADIANIDVSADNTVLAAIRADGDIFIWRQVLTKSADAHVVDEYLSQWGNKPAEAQPHVTYRLPPTKEELHRPYKLLTQSRVGGADSFGNEGQKVAVGMAPQSSHVTIGKQVTYVSGDFVTSLDLPTNPAGCCHMDRSFVYAPAKRADSRISALRYTGIESRFIGSTSPPIAMNLRPSQAAGDVIAMGSTHDESQLIAVIRSGAKKVQTHIFDLVAGRRRAAAIAVLCMQRKYDIPFTSAEVRHVLRAVLAPPALDLHPGDVAAVRAVTLAKHIPCLVVQRHPHGTFEVACLPLCGPIPDDIADYAGMCAEVQAEDVVTVAEEVVRRQETDEQHAVRSRAQLVARSFNPLLTGPVAAADDSGSWTTADIALALRRGNLDPTQAVELVGKAEPDDTDELIATLQLH